LTEYTEEELLPLSALQHLLFCPRQCGLIHVEGLWAENLWTAEGKVMHDRVHGGGGDFRDGVRQIFGVSLRSLSLGLSGKADVVELHPRGGGSARAWTPYPVEFKRGRPKKDLSDRVQLCAQGICLEEMTGTGVPGGALFYGQKRRRIEVAFDAALREATVKAAAELHEIVDSGKTPPPRRGPHCEKCSLVDLCMPDICGGKGRVQSYLKGALRMP